MCQLWYIKHVIMNPFIRTIEVKSILFESNDPEVLVKGKMTKGHMTFDTDVIISQSQLNCLINQLRKQNKGFEMSQLLTSEKMYNDETLYSAEFSTVSNRQVDLEDLSVIRPIKQIRA